MTMTCSFIDIILKSCNRATSWDYLLFAYTKTKVQISDRITAQQMHANLAADQHLCSCYMDGIIPLFSKSEISSLYPSSVAVHSLVCVGPGRKHWSQVFL